MIVSPRWQSVSSLLSFLSLASCGGGGASSSKVPPTTTGPACTLNGTVGYLTPPAYVPPSGSTCDVVDIGSLGSCLAAANQGRATNLRFTRMINCHGTDACFVDLSHVNRPMVLFGSPGANAGFRRTASYTYPIINLTHASGVSIANLEFDEGPDDPACTPRQVNGASYNYPCQSTINVDHSANIVLDQLTILHSKNHAIQFSATRGITIRDSHIQDAGVFGIWSGSDQSQMSSDVSVANNLIEDVKSNGIYLSFTENATIKETTLRHNHRVALFNVCGGLCPGGQIDMLDNSSLRIDSNEIRDGQIDLGNATGQTDGIEITDRNQDVVIVNNEIANNLGAGIGANPGASGTNFQITANKIYGNGTALFGLSGTGIQESGDCFSQ